jgi:hypothetical protein
MPRGDGRGPHGMGPMGGRAAGHCAGSGIRGGRGNRNMFHAAGLTGWQRAAAFPSGAAMSREDELASLRSRAQFMEEEKKSVEDRIAELEKSEGKIS